MRKLHTFSHNNITIELHVSSYSTLSPIRVNKDLLNGYWGYLTHYKENIVVEGWPLVDEEGKIIIFENENEIVDWVKSFLTNKNL
jgi:hypothetical protein